MLMEALSAITNFATNNPILCMMLCIFIYKMYQARQPWPDYGGEVVQVKNLQEWQKLLSEAGAQKLVIIDCYAEWCPPCKAAAPIYAKMSKDYSDSVVFAKCNVDEARDVAKELQVTAMPTFTLFKRGLEVNKMTGFGGEAKLRALLEQHGGKIATKSD